MMLDATHSWCAKCKQHGLLFPLHGEKGGPMVCLTCRGAWHAEHGKRRNLGRVVIRAIKAFLNAGGSIRHVDDLKLTALCSEGFGGGIPELEDPLGYLHGVAKLTDEIIELTSELLNEAIALTHPDKHPPERREQATRVTQKLTDLKPFVFPGPQPKPPPAPPRNASVNVQSADLKEPSRPAYPCPQCKATTPYFYCDACKVEHNKRWEAERESTPTPSSGNGTRGGRRGRPGERRRSFARAVRPSKASGRMRAIARMPADNGLTGRSRRRRSASISRR